MADPFYRGALEAPDELVGARLVVRPVRSEDAPALREAIEQSRDHIRPWLPWADGHRTLEETLDFAAGQRADWIRRDAFDGGAFRRADGRVVGGARLHVHDWPARRFEIGYWLRAGETGRGYAREAVALLSRLAFETLRANRVMIRCDADNHPSRRVAEASGYLLEGRHRRDGLTPAGELRDTLVFALLREEYEAALPGWQGFFLP